MAEGFWRLLIIVGVTLLGLLWLEQPLQSHYVLELFLLMVGCIVALAVLVGVGSQRSWGWPLAAILLALSAFDALVVYLTTRQHGMVFGIVLVMSLLGLLMAVLRSTEPDALDTLPKMEFAKS